MSHSLKSIAEGWANLIVDRNRELAFSRLEKCDSCPYKMQLSQAGAKLLTAINYETSTYYCRVCGCPLASLTRVPSEHCPNPEGARWNAVVNSYY